MKKALLIIGSPRKPSNSASLGRHVSEQLAANGWAIEEAHARKAVATQEGIESLSQSVEDADLVLVAFPLYVDSIPAPLIRAFEELSARRRDRGAGPSADRTPQRLAAIVNSGFPEAAQNRTALAICELFARQAGFEWAGGLALGGGEMLGRKPLKEAGGIAQPIGKALDIAAAALADGKPIPDEAAEKLAKPAIPSWLYTTMGNWGWRKQAKAHGARGLIHDRPY